ncbi:bifunctional 3-oxoadipate enol-lactonase/4-carboxymuconolactone decarboxylase PcaDC [Glaciibacter sp. 2TAF33]|uniref:bifunctional 3-oxoadipate enol-lactonase/4-carboxymuconolactone decarboxylase PcaDC n=1 Tax=Glaciibacter sp. 2TAF33 TaxID=3233015 RepID=UPI003F93458D
MSKPTIRCTVTPVRSGAPDAQLIVLGPSLGTTTALWEGAVAALSEQHRVLCFDLPGHGYSPAAAEPFTVAELAASVLDVVDSIGGGSFHYAGISLGGAIGLALAVNHPERLQSLAVICSAAKIGTDESWRERAAQVRASGTPSLVRSSSERWFAPGFLERNPSAGSSSLETLMEVDDESYARCCEALAGFDLREAVSGIGTPTLCVSGEFDVATPTALVQELADAVPGARLVTIPGVAHLPAYEAPDVVASLVMAHIQAVEGGTVDVGTVEGSTAPQHDPLGGGAARATTPTSPTAAETYTAGMRVRRAVLGDAHVDRATAAITPETADFQDFITRYAWGEIWTRPGLDRRTRSFLTIASLVTGGHEHELAMHVRAALTNGLTRAEISEAIMHTAIYAGVPAANSALGVARDTFAVMDSAADAAASSDLIS